FLAALHPGREPWSTAPHAFHISLGLPLAQYPLVGAALDAIEAMAALAAPEPVALAALLPWLRSPFIRRAETEAEARAGLEHTLRRTQRARWTWHDLRPQTLALCPHLAAAVRAGLKAAEAWPARQDHRHWSASFAQLWEAVGWPGDRPLTTAEFQTRQAWERLQDEFSRLDQVAPGSITSGEARRRLRQLAAGRVFQPQAAAAPVQVLGWLEAAGMEFSHLRVIGLHDGALPAPAAPNPFLPLEWQRAQGLPRASAVQEAAFAARVWERLRCSAGVMVASYPAHAGDEALRPSPLLAGLEQEPERPPPPPPPSELVLESVADLGGPALPAAQAQGGSRIFTEQSACPFRAFAHLRLKAETPGPLPDGLAATTRGQLLHALLEVVWSLLQSRDELLAKSAAELRELVERSAATIVENEERLHGRPGLAALERERLVATTLAWLELEKQRRPFQVEAQEGETALSFAGLDLRLKLDRVDTLAGGGLALLDYKSGTTTLRDWGYAAKPRMRAPQLPLYLVSHPQRDQIAAVAFAQVRRGDMSFHGKEREPGVLLGKPLHTRKPLPWPVQLEIWQHELERVAEEYRTGLAPVDPLDATTCTHCDLPALCRIYEVRAGEGSDGAGDTEEAEADDVE
ncbi:MAG: PD-(D/E)XK nuclease family protein, partial [Terriglobales bacterium]